MKLILSSCDFLNEKSKKRILNNIDKSIEKVRVLFIPNKLFNIDDLDKYYQRLAIDGFTKKENIFIFNEKDSRSFNNLDIDLIYIGGGNTFFTLKKLKDSEFDKEIIKYIKNGVIYVGGSCGAHIASSNIKHVLYFDNNEVKLDDLEGLNLFDGIIIPHYTEEREKIYNKLIKEKKYKVYPLTNDGTLIVEDNKIKILDNEI